MEQKIIKVYYDENGLPYQDLALTKPYSIVGSEFTGANNATEVHFYVANIDDTYTWVANIKLQDGTMTYRLLTSATDEESDPYKLLVLDNGITAKKGFIYVGLNGYGGETLIEEVEGVLTINGNPVIVATGTISIALNYNPVVIPLGTSIEPTEMQQILANLSQKLEQDDLDTALVDYLQLAGGTMTGAISQPVAPLVDDDLANKKYVDDEVKVANDDIADIIDGDLIVHTAYHAMMDANGRNLVDLAKTSDLTSGIITVKKAETAQKDFSGNVITTYYQPKLTFDTTPTQSSIKPVTSGGIKTYVDNIAIDMGTFEKPLELINAYAGDGLFYAFVGIGSPLRKMYVLFFQDHATLITPTGISYYQSTGGVWTLTSAYALTKNVGASLDLNSTNFVLALKNSAGTILSSVDLPLESVVVSGSYDDTTESLILTLQNGTEIPIPVADLVGGLVPNTRTIAGVDLADDITASELNTALGIAKTDIVVNTADYVSLELDSKPVQVQSAIEDKNGADITTTYATASRVSDIEAVIPSVASPTNQLTARSEVVKIMQAPASTTLTDDQITKIINGVQISGAFLGGVNPRLFTATESSGYYIGLAIIPTIGSGTQLATYRINITTKIIDTLINSTVMTANGELNARRVVAINNKVLATYPSSTGRFDSTVIDGVLSYSERIYEYANMYLSNNATAVSLTADTLTKFAIPMTGGASSGITISTANDNLTILKTGVYQVIVTFNTSVSVNDTQLEIAVYKNTSTLIPELKNASTLDTSILQGIVSLTANDVIDVRVKAGGNCDMTVINATISVRRIS